MATQAKPAPPPGIDRSVWIQMLLKQAEVSQAEVARLTESNESVVSKVIRGVWLPRHYTARGLERQLTIQQTICDLVDLDFDTVWPGAPA